jgi:hypothetical protein
VSGLARRSAAAVRVVVGNRRLSVNMAAALRDLGQGPLVRTVAGWGLEGAWRWHSSGTVDGLIARGLGHAVNREKLGAVLTITPAGMADARRLWPDDFQKD